MKNFLLNFFEGLFSGRSRGLSSSRTISYCGSRSNGIRYDRRTNGLIDKWGNEVKTKPLKKILKDR